MENQIIDISKNHCKFANGLIVQWEQDRFQVHRQVGKGMQRYHFQINLTLLLLAQNILELQSQRLWYLQIS